MITTTLRVSISAHFRDKNTAGCRGLGTCPRSHADMVLSDPKLHIAPGKPFSPHAISQCLCDLLPTLELCAMAALMFPFRFLYCSNCRLKSINNT